jgi:hypothetical protein
MTSDIKFDPPETSGKFQTEVCPKYNIIRITLLEVATPEDVNQFRAGPLMASGCSRIVWDFKQDDLTAISADDIRRFTEYVPEVPEGNRLAFVVPNELGFGIGRMLTTRMELSGNKARVSPFYTMDEALAWLISPQD